MKELNILLLGETGVGKSTWINGLVNYLTYDTLSEAEHGEVFCLIPSSFTMTDENFDTQTIKWGEFDHNESQKTGQSATQRPKTYVFGSAEMKIRIIDTPGIGDTRGVEADKKNMQMIMSHLAQYDELHGICILLKPNSARLTVMFKFCIKELLTHLHVDACKNMVICFTNARGTFFRPGDTLPSLQELLKETPNINIPLNKQTVYCMDNESVRFLMAIKSGMNFDPTERENYDSSWKKSVDESTRLIAHISGLEPHLIQKTISLNSVRENILNLSKPIAEMSKLIQQNIDIIEDKQKEVIATNMSKQELEKQLHVKMLDLVATDIDHPCTVCTASKCTQPVQFGNVTKTEYKNRCHEQCQLTVSKNLICCAELQNCWAMQPGGQVCRICGCSWNVHMHITYETKQVEKDVIDENVQKLINEKDGTIKAIEEHKKQLEKKKAELQDEIRIINSVTAGFACFLKVNAIAPYNDALKAYMDKIIQDEEEKVALRGDRKTLEALLANRRQYMAEIEAIEKAMAQPNSGCINYADAKAVDEQIKVLYNLHEAGRILRQVMDVVEKSNDAAAHHTEKVIEVKSKSFKERLYGKYVAFKSAVGFN